MGGLNLSETEQHKMGTDGGISSSINTQLHLGKSWGVVWMVRTPAEPSDSNVNRWQKQEMERKSVSTARGKGLYSLAMGKPRKTTWLERTGSSDELQRRETTWELHLGAHLLHTALNLHPHLLPVIRPYQPQAGTQRSDLFPQSSSLYCLPAAGRCRML